MDARCADRPLALVGGRLSLLGEAVVRDLADRGYDVHVAPEAFAADLPDLPQHARARLVPVEARPGPREGALLDAVVATRRPVRLVVVEDGALLAAEAAPVVAARSGGRLLDLSDDGHSPAPRTTVLTESRWTRWLPRRVGARLRLRPHERADDASAVARMAVDAALAGRARASYALRRYPSG